jgi:hypothetical protein
MAEMHKQPGKMMGGSDAEHQHGTQAGMIMGGGIVMPAATASAEDIEGGARLVQQPKDLAPLGALREHVRMKAQRMASGECPMMALGGRGEPAAARARGPTDRVGDRDWVRGEYAEGAR